MKAVLITAAFISAAHAADFAERWPAPEGAAPAIVEREPVERVRRHPRPRGFVCHRRHFMRNHHRYWRCQR